MGSYRKLYIIRVNVIHDSPCIYHELLEKIQIAEKYLFQYKFVDCVVKDMNVINQRLRTRKCKRSQIPETSEEYYQATLKSTQYPSSNYLVVNSDSPVESYIDDVIEYLKNSLIQNITEKTVSFVLVVSINPRKGLS